MITHNVCFGGQIRKIFSCSPRLSGAMVILRHCEGDNERFCAMKCHTRYG